LEALVKSASLFLATFHPFAIGLREPDQSLKNRFVGLRGELPGVEGATANKVIKDVRTVFAKRND